MPNRKFTKRRSSRRPKQSFKKRVLSVMKSSAELKEVVETSTDTSLTDASSFSETITNPAQGDGDNQRIGDRLEIKDLSIKASVFSGTASGLVRCYVYQSMGDVLPQNMILLPNDFYLKIQDSQSKYKVLYDRVISLDPDYRSSYLFNIRIPVKKMGKKAIHFDAAASTVVDGGTILIKITTDNTTVSQMTVDCNYRYRYVDI